MGDQSIRDELAELRAELATQRERHDTEVGALRAQLATSASARRRPRRRASRPGRLTAALALAVLLALVPVAVLAVAFADLNTAGPEFQPSIQLIADAGISVGRDDPDAADPNIRLYDPKANVTREQMAIFLAKTAGLGTFPAVANAKTVGGYAPNGLTRVSRAEGTGARLPLTATFAEVTRLTITAPGKGLVVVTGAASVFIGGPPNSIATVELRLHDITVAGGREGPVLVVTGHNMTSFFQSATPTFMFNAGTGGPRIYALEARVTNGAAEAVRFGSQMTAIYAPFGADGAAPAAAEIDLPR